MRRVLIDNCCRLDAFVQNRSRVSAKERSMPSPKRHFANDRERNSSSRGLQAMAYSAERSSSSMFQPDDSSTPNDVTIILQQIYTDLTAAIRKAHRYLLRVNTFLSTESKPGPSCQFAAQQSSKLRRRRETSLSFKQLEASDSPSKRWRHTEGGGSRASISSWQLIFGKAWATVAPITKRETSNLSDLPS